MRGTAPAQSDFLTVVNLNAHVPVQHPLRTIIRVIRGQQFEIGD